MYIKLNENNFLFISESMTGKLENVLAINTNTFKNPLCERNSKLKNAICNKCYARQFISYKGKNIDRSINSNEFLKTRLLTKNELQEIKETIESLNPVVFRFESFGELETMIQLINYNLIASYCKNVHFALWTKNYNLLYRFNNSNLYNKAKNLKFIVSSLYMNKPLNNNAYKILGCDSVFTVYNLEYLLIKFNNDLQAIDSFINCNKKQCFTCNNSCYTGNQKRKNELLKSESLLFDMLVSGEKKSIVYNRYSLKNKVVDSMVLIYDNNNFKICHDNKSVTYKLSITKKDYTYRILKTTIQVNSHEHFIKFINSSNEYKDPFNWFMLDNFKDLVLKGGNK